MVRRKISTIKNKIITKRKNNKQKSSSNFEDSNKIMKLFLLIVIVNKGQGEAIQNILSKNKVSASFAFHGVEYRIQKAYHDDHDRGHQVRMHDELIPYQYQKVKHQDDEIHANLDQYNET